MERRRRKENVQGTIWKVDEEIREWHVDAIN